MFHLYGCLCSLLSLSQSSQFCTSLPQRKFVAGLLRFYFLQTPNPLWKMKFREWRISLTLKRNPFPHSMEKGRGLWVPWIDETTGLLPDSPKKRGGTQSCWPYDAPGSLDPTQGSQAHQIPMPSMPSMAQKLPNWSFWNRGWWISQL